MSNSPNYVQQVIRDLVDRLPTCPMDLIDLYALLALTRGPATTLEDVHDAWSIWQNTSKPDHKSLVPFDRLTAEVQQLDRKYMEAIHEVSMLPDGPHAAWVPTGQVVGEASAAPLVFEHVRTDDGGYRVFEKNGVGTGAVTYDPDYGDIGIVTVDGTLSTQLDPAMEARICRDIGLIRDEAAVFDRLEYVYRRQTTRAVTAR